jgi:DNA-binding transcriptional MerR regulator
MSQKYYTIAEISKILNIPESTLRFYRNKFEKFIPYFGEGRKKRYAEEAINIFKEIAELLRNNVTADDVAEHLTRVYTTYVNISNEQQQQTAITQQQIFFTEKYIQTLIESDLEIRKEIASTLQIIANQQESIAELQKELLKIQEKYEKTIEERDNKIVAEMRKILNKKKKSFWPWVKGKGK